MQTGTETLTELSNSSASHLGESAKRWGDGEPQTGTGLLDSRLGQDGGGGGGGGWEETGLVLSQAVGQTRVSSQRARRVVLLARRRPFSLQDGVADAVQAVDDNPVLKGDEWKQFKE